MARNSHSVNSVPMLAIISWARTENFVEFVPDQRALRLRGCRGEERAPRDQGGEGEIDRSIGRCPDMEPVDTALRATLRL